MNNGEGMKHKVSELDRALLDAAVAKALNGEIEAKGFMQQDGGGMAAWDGDLAIWRGWCPSTDWRVGGPIIERERIWTGYCDENSEWPGKWFAQLDDELPNNHHQIGDTPLQAAMRCFVSKKFGSWVDL